jgi:anti-sigma regulatory factor (Ser/Thr protein kinase)
LSIELGRSMVKVRTRGERVRSYILENVEKYPQDIAKRTAEHFGTTRQAVNKHVRHLVSEKALVEEGNTRNRKYKLCALAELVKVYEMTAGLEEDVVWREDILPFLGQLPGNVVDIWRHGFTEMFNNAIDHSSAGHISVKFSKTATTTEILIYDDGIGIFKKIQTALNLLDERHAVFELAKGKLTTDPSRHTGEGIFFSSRMFDQFRIMSSETYFSHEFGKDEDWVLENQQSQGTAVFMKLNNHTARSTHKVFSEFQSGEDLGFTKTVVPVRLAQYGDDKLVSRSQAKRLLARVDRFKTVLMDFKEVTSIGQAFADEIFRVFRNSHPEIELYAINASVEVQDPINRAQSSGYQLQSMIMASGTNPTSDARPESGEDPIGDG